MPFAGKHRRFGTKQASVATRRARLMLYLVNARATTMADEQLAHQFDLPVAAVKEVRAQSFNENPAAGIAAREE